MEKNRYELDLQESADEVIGYTFGRKLTLSSLDALIKQVAKTRGELSPDLCPTVYYRGGHRTVTHALESNRGWEGDGRRWLFFGNVEFRAETNPERTILPFRGSRIPDAYKAILATTLRNHKTGADALAHLRSLPAEKTSRSKDEVALEDKLFTMLEKFMKRVVAWSSFSPHDGSFETIATNDGILTGMVALFEIFRDRSDPVWHTHPSRNRFYTVREDSQFRERLLQLATVQVAHDLPLRRPAQVTSSPHRRQPQASTAVNGRRP